MADLPTSGILYEIMRSFVDLAKTLNLSHTVANLGSTRQTVRRHIELLETARNEKLFRVENRQYHLTEQGFQALPEARHLLERCESWFHGNSGSINELDFVSEQGDNGFSFHMQQHPITKVWNGGTELIQQGLQCWADSQGQIESEALAAIRPYLIVYRRHQGGWLCVEVGEKSSYTSWFGWAWSRSSIGRSLDGMSAGPGFAQFIEKSYQEVYVSRGIRLDHVCTQLPRDNSDLKHPVNFQRLLLGCAFPDGAFALAALIDRTYKIDIEGVSHKMIQQMSSDLVMSI